MIDWIKDIAAMICLLALIGVLIAYAWVFDTPNVHAFLTGG